MNKVRFSRNIPKEKVLFNQSALTGIEYTLNSLIRDTLFEESFTTRLGKGILSEQEINEMGKVFYRISHTNTDELYHSHINTLTIHPSQLVPVIMQFLKYLQGAGYAYQGHIEEQNKLANQVNSYSRINKRTRSLSSGLYLCSSFNKGSGDLLFRELRNIRTMRKYEHTSNSSMLASKLTKNLVFNRSLRRKSQEPMSPPALAKFV